MFDFVEGCDIVVVHSVPLETTKTKLLGTCSHENLKWNCDILQKNVKVFWYFVSYKKIKNFTPFHIPKQLAECLILSVIGYKNVVRHPPPDYLIKRLQRVQFAAAVLVANHHASISDVLK